MGLEAEAPIMAFRIAIVALATTLGAGCSLVQEKTFGESIDEASTGTQIKAKLFSVGGVSRFGEVDVEVSDRLVLLSGRVPSETDRVEAERIAWSLSAVDEVANEIVITKLDIARDFNDRWITEQIRARIIGDKDVKGVNYNIQVFEGIVYLLGFAQDEDELRRAAEHAASVKGVLKVVSYVKVRGRKAQTPSSGASSIGALAPITAPDRQPARREGYSDPYAVNRSGPPQ